MPKLELKDQIDIIHSIKGEGGYARKWASQFQVGVPDLICALPNVGGFLMEVKSIIVEQPGDMHQTLNVQMKQRHELFQYNKAGMKTFLGIVVHGEGNLRRFYVMPNWIEELAASLNVYPLLYDNSWNPSRQVFNNVSNQVERMIQYVDKKW